MTDLTSEDIVQLLILVGFGLYISMAVVRLFRGRVISAFLTIAFWIVAFGVMLTGYSYRDELGGVTQRVIATVVPGLPFVTAPGQVTVLRSPDGQFVLKARSGATRLTFVFDTGASAVVLRAEDAARLGIDTRHLRFDVPVGTANGRAFAAEATLKDLSIGPLTERDVAVLVTRPGALHENLLGMSFLDRLGSYAVAGNKLLMQTR